VRDVTNADGQGDTEGSSPSRPADGVVLPPGAAWKKRKKKGRRAPMGDGWYVHRLTPSKGDGMNRKQRRTAAAHARHKP